MYIFLTFVIKKKADKIEIGLLLDIFLKNIIVDRDIKHFESYKYWNYIYIDK